MIFSKKFVNSYIELDEDIKTIAEDMTRVGNEYDLVAPLILATKLVTGLVTECEMHPESDHLHICKVDIKTEVLNIVCGAPNMRKGIKVIVALDGAELPGGVIKKSIIRGAESNGMCCSFAELGLDKKFLKEEDYDGIHELPIDAPIGVDALKYLELDDEIIDFDLTSNRSDLLSVLGLAYEVGAIYGKKVNEPVPLYDSVDDNFKNDITLKVETDNVSSFLLGRVENIKIVESPSFIKNRLIACGIRPINNVVDISNYIMLETGQPLHFYDADLVGKVIGARMALEGEQLTTLDGENRTLTEKDLVIFNENGPIGLAGVMGGLETEINENTKNVLIESAIFDPGTIRKTSKRILRSEASSRFEKGLCLSRSYLALERSKELLSKYANGTPSKDTIEYVKEKKEDKIIKITLEKINKVLGMNLTIEDVTLTLEKLAFKVKYENDYFVVSVPDRRIDVNIKEDIIEEVGRIYGVDNIEPTMPKTNKKGNIDKYNRDLKIRLSSLGLNETLTYSLVSTEQSMMFQNELDSIKVLEPMGVEKSVLRTTLIPSLMEVYEYNKSRNNKDISVFEIGEIYYKNNEEYIEEERLSILMTGKYITGINTKVMVDFYYIKGIVENILDYLGYKKRYDFNILNTVKELHPYQSASVNINGIEVGFLGKMHPSIYKDDVYVCEINLTKLKSIKTEKMKYKEMSKYPKMEKDISFIIDNNIICKDLIKDIKKFGGKILVDILPYDEYKMENEKSLTFTLTYMDEFKTLTEEEVMASFNNIIENITKKYNIKIKNM